MCKEIPETTYELVFIPQDEEVALSKTEAVVFESRLRKQFGLEGLVKRSPLYPKQYVVYLFPKKDQIMTIVRFMVDRKFGSEVAQKWLLNSLQAHNPWSMIMGIGTGKDQQAIRAIRKWLTDVAQVRERRQKRKLEE